MFRVFARNSLLSYFLIVPLVLIMHIGLLIDPTPYVLADSADVQSPLWQTLMGHVVPGGITWRVLSLSIPMLSAFIVAGIVNRYDLAPMQSALGGLFYVLLCGQLRPSIGLHPAMIFVVLLLIAIDRLYSAMRKKTASKSIAWGFAYATFGGLLWAKGIVFLPFLVVILIILRLANSRTLMAAMLGIVGCLILTAAVCIICGVSEEVASEYVDSFLSTTAYWRTGWRSWIYLCVCGVLTVLSILSAQNRLSHLSIIGRRQMRSATWFVVFGIFLMLLPGYSYESQALAAIGASMLMPQFMVGVRSVHLQEGITAILFGVGLWIHLL